MTDRPDESPWHGTECDQSPLLPDRPDLTAIKAANRCSREAEARGRGTYHPPDDPYLTRVRFEDGELVTTCRLMQVGPACPHPCDGCRSNPITFGELRERYPDV
jgi:hypothetical protein